ncbi:MAG TPA: signal peptidase II [Phycisphaerales bacterium]|nr:signal peptidase II [Phycisphaerales bacterium]
MTGSAIPTLAVRAGRTPRAWFVLIAVVVIGLAADLGSKWWAFEKIADQPVHVDRAQVLEYGPRRLGELLPAHRPVTVVPHVLDLSLVLNPGAVFGIGAGQRWFFVVFTVAAMVAGVALFAVGTRARQTAAHVAIGLLISGGLGNLYDRLAYGCVRDFLHPLPGVKWPFGITTPWSGEQIWPYVSNIADLWLIVGIGMLVVILWRSDKAEQKAARGQAAEGAA